MVFCVCADANEQTVTLKYLLPPKQKHTCALKAGVVPAAPFLSPVDLMVKMPRMTRGMNVVDLIDRVPGLPRPQPLPSASSALGTYGADIASIMGAHRPGMSGFMNLVNSSGAAVPASMLSRFPAMDAHADSSRAMAPSQQHYSHLARSAYPPAGYPHHYGPPPPLAYPPSHGYPAPHAPVYPPVAREYPAYPPPAYGPPRAYGQPPAYGPPPGYPPPAYPPPYPARSPYDDGREYERRSDYDPRDQYERGGRYRDSYSRGGARPASADSTRNAYFRK